MSSFPKKTSLSSSSLLVTAHVSANSLVSLNLLNSSSYSFRALVFRASASANSISVLSLATFAAIAVPFTTEEAADDPFDLRLLESWLEHLQMRDFSLPISCLISDILSGYLSGSNF